MKRVVVIGGRCSPADLKKVLSMDVPAGDAAAAGFVKSRQAGADALSMRLYEDAKQLGQENASLKVSLAECEKQKSFWENEARRLQAELSYKNAVIDSIFGYVSILEEAMDDSDTGSRG